MLVLPRELDLLVVGVVADLEAPFPDVLEDPLTEFGSVFTGFLGEATGWETYNYNTKYKDSYLYLCMYVCVL